MPVVEPKEWAAVGNADLIGCKLLKIEFERTMITLYFTKLVEIKLWTPERVTLNLRNKGSYSVSPTASESDRDYWTLRTEEVLAPLQVCSFYVSDNDVIIISFGVTSAKNIKTLFDFQLAFNKPSGAMLRT